VSEKVTKLVTSYSQTLEDIKQDAENERKLLVADLKKSSKKELAKLPDTLSQKEKTDYLYKVQPQFDQIYKMVAKGYRKADIADVLGVTQVCFRRLCRDIPELKAVINIGTEDLIDGVETSLHQLAQGFTYQEEVINPFCGEKETLHKYQAPALGAIKYVLGNKRGEEYAEKKQIIKVIELGKDVRAALMSLTPEELTLAIKKADAQTNAVDAVFSERETSSDDD
jgi:hypothetical protein